MIQALIFDFDGLILDTEVPEFQAWQEIYQEHGCHLPLSIWATCIGASSDTFDPYAYLESLTGRPVERDIIRSKRRRRIGELLETQAILPGVEEYITDAKRLGLKLGLASSSPGDWVTGHVLRLGIKEHFDCIKCSEDVKEVKPAPDLYQSVLESLNISADEAIALEDSPNGILAAKRAGLFCVVVPNSLTRQLSLDQADIRLTSLSDLPLRALLWQVIEKR